MASILDAVLGVANQSNISDLAQHFGLDENDIKNAVGHILPVLSRGLKQHVEAQPDSDVMQKAQQSQQFVDDDNAKIYSEDAVSQGNEAVKTLLGNDDNAQQVAQKVADSTGVSNDVISKLLPMAATMLMGSSSKQASEGGSSSLLGFLDRDHDGSIADDVIGLASKFFK